MLSPDGSSVALAERVTGENIFKVISLTDRSASGTYRSGQPAANVVCLAWSQDGRSLAYILADEAENTHTLWFQPLGQEKPRLVADLHEEQVYELSGFALSPDGKSFALLQGSWNHNAVLINGLK